MRHCTPFLLALLFLAFSSHPATAQSQGILNVIGDSYVANHQRPKSEAWHYKLAAELSLTYNNYGKNGACVAFDRTHDGRFNFGPAMYTKTATLDPGADMVLIIAGHNDAVKVGSNADSLAMFRDSLELLISGIARQCPRARIGYVTPWYVDRPGFAEVCSVIREVCHRHGIPVLDNHSPQSIIQVRDADFRKRYFQRPDDTAHLNAAGHDLFLGVARKWFDENMQIDHFIDRLMSRMTLQEKIGQLSQLIGGDIQTGAPTSSHIGREVAAGRVGSVLNTQGIDKILALQRLAVDSTRLGIPLLVGLDVIHGHQTLFPVPLGLASTWDMEGIRRSAEIAAREAAANGIAWTFSPMVDIALDSRWGRQSESAGEDPYLSALMAKAMVQGYQPTILACVKHFALYGAVESGKDYNYVDMSRQRMFNQYFAGYKAGAEAGAGSFMSSYNTVDGMPASGNRWLLTDILRRQWGFRGFIVTDYSTIAEMPVWGVGDIRTNTARSLKAGCDMDMVSESYVRYLPQLIEQGKVSMDDIDQACRRILEAKYRLGLFDNPYKFGDKALADSITYCSEHRREARRLAGESFVLLRNQDNLLPLSRNRKIALIGPLADNRDDIVGSWSFSADPRKYRTLREALAQAIEGQGTLTYAQGCNVMDDAYLQRTVSEGHGVRPVPFVDEDKANAEAIRIAKRADVIICAMGELAWMNGEGASRTDIEMPAPQRRLLMKLRKLGKPIILLNFAGRATAIRWESENLDAIINVWYGSECPDALADVLFGDVSPSGRLTVTMPKTTGQEPLYYNHMNTGRPIPDNKPFWVFSENYIDVQNGPLYPFGYGLTYTTFRYGKLRLEGTTASIDITNTGSRAAHEVVQLYIRALAASSVRPVMELKGFERIHLEPGQTKTVTFPITRQMLSYYNPDLEFVCEPGEYEIMVGPDCKHVQKQKLIIDIDNKD